ncbi:MAG: DUF2784 family protein, partial [Planctomycetales bacterium]|nr:DUF2784 family protein [Planctomycetales bacterium]
RIAAGQAPQDGAFVARLAHDLLFYQGPPWVFTAAYVAFGLVVLGTWVLAPPRRPARRAAPRPA